MAENENEEPPAAAAANGPPVYVNYGGKGIGPYNESEAWDNFVERLSGHLDACKVNNVNQRRDILVSTVDANTYTLMKNLLGEVKPREKTYDELIVLVKSQVTHSTVAVRKN